MNDVSVYLGRQREESPIERISTVNNLTSLTRNFSCVLIVTYTSASFHTSFLSPPIFQQLSVTLPQLICLKTKSGSINILERIGTHYWKLGVLLLDDTTGEVTQAIIEHQHEDATKINFQIFQKWIQGKGKLPVEWSTLIEVLKDVGLSKLATEMEQTLK